MGDGSSAPPRLIECTAISSVEEGMIPACSIRTFYKMASKEERLDGLSNVFV
jgi:hypothetical protein